MQKIFTAGQIKRCDAFTIINEPIASIALMERASKAVVDFLDTEMDAVAYEIYCGQGNNGGDGLAIARMLSELKKQVSVVVLQEKENGTADFEINLQRLKLLPDVTLKFIKSVDEFVPAAPGVIIIDALLGTGLEGAAKGLAKEAIRFLNAQKNDIIAIDVPSGLLCDDPLKEDSTVISASLTITFQTIKLAFLFPENNSFVGIVKVVDIGLHKDFIASEKTKNYLVEKLDVTEMLPARKRFAHKGNFGHALLLAGATGKYGAALLAAKACLRSGAGLLTVHSAAGLQPALNSFVPSAMFNADITSDRITELPDLSKYNVVAAGSGMGTGPETMQVIKMLIQQCKSHLVLDADALNCLSENKTWLPFLPPGTILTPHPKEFERLCGKWGNSFERLQMQKDFSIKYNCYVVYKGAYTTISTPVGNCYFNTTGNAGMAKGGSGDVLTGVIAGLLAQGLSKAEACITAVYIHGFAGDLARKENGEISMLPEDLIEQLGKAFIEVQRI